ncbi:MULTISPECIES: hypothetical protein [Cytobacillus]|uniref:YhjD n=1 Tax=Cytobacillus oceanisediminis TaxID=665099 RepID=A0ABX3CN17_9BACI|nr:hypothetical protein [Cytobacillus oceanisediminis]EFV75062.1 hypothetical protein HMPREF1013_04707 [Bacillus sp. 2_A_57_CT2]MCM3402823.1 hypothetical protein [Cytobacillus oceanisediminis]OHX44608.1 hypothetical protein BBV17_25635 [Cytobacillus oceanisediminis]
MTRIPEKDRDILEQAMYLPMLLTILERDRNIFDKGQFKLKGPYLQLIEETINAVQRDLKEVKSAMRKGQMRVEQVARDEAFTMFLFIYKGFEEQHNYFNPRIRNKVQELLELYLYKRLN